MYDEAAVRFAGMLPANYQNYRFVLVKFSLLVFVGYLQNRDVKITQRNSEAFKPDELVGLIKLKVL